MEKPRKVTGIVCGLAVLSLVAFNAQATAAEAKPPEVVVTVTGESAHSFEEAKEDALRKAVEMGAGTEVFSDTRVADFQLMHDTIVCRAEGYVRSYDIPEKKEADGVYKVKMRAVVAVGRIKDDWGALQILLVRKGRPNILILVSETGTRLSRAGNAAEYKLRELLGERGIDIVDDEALAAVANRDAVHAMIEGDEKKAAAVATQLHAGWLVLGRASVRSGEPKTVYGVDLVPAVVDLFVKVVAADNAQQIASKSASCKANSRDDAASAAKRALEGAAEQVEQEVFKRIVLAWSRDLDVGTKFEVVGTRIPTEVLNVIVERLRMMEGVKMVTIIDTNPQLSTLSVVTRLEPMELGRAIVSASGERVEITGQSPGRIGFKMRGDNTAPR